MECYLKFCSLSLSLTHTHTHAHKHNTKTLSLPLFYRACMSLRNGHQERVHRRRRGEQGSLASGHQEPSDSALPSSSTRFVFTSLPYPSPSFTLSFHCTQFVLFINHKSVKMLCIGLSGIVLPAALICS